MNFQEQLNRKMGTVQDALRLIESGDVVACAGDCNEPLLFLDHLHEIAPNVNDVMCYKGRIGTYPFVTSEGMDGHINTAGFFYGPGWHEAHKLRNVSYVPACLSDYAGFVRQHRPCNVFVAAVSPMDEDGNFCVGLSLMWEIEMHSTAKKIILEVNPELPRVNGGLKINISEAACVYTTDKHIMTVPSLQPGPTDIKIAQFCRELVRDGDCIQLGIGALPNAVAEQLMDLHDLGIHTEMFTATMGELIRRGVVTGERKQIDRGMHIGAFAGGDSALYETLGSNPACKIMPCSYANNPFVIAQNDNVVSINTCIEVDLTGQVCSESIGPRQYSGTGGATDFAYGALHSKGGRGIIAFESVTKKGVSKIETMLARGAQVSISRNFVDYIVTENGVAPMRGRSIKERVNNLISVAHPEHRARLRREAQELFYI